MQIHLFISNPMIAYGVQITTKFKITDMILEPKVKVIDTKSVLQLELTKGIHIWYNKCLSGVDCKGLRI